MKPSRNQDLRLKISPAGVAFFFLGLGVPLPPSVARFPLPLVPRLLLMQLGAEELGQGVSKSSHRVNKYHRGYCLLGLGLPPPFQEDQEAS